MVRAAGRGGAKGKVRVEAILSAARVAELRRQGVGLSTKKLQGQSVAQRATLLAAQGFEVWRKYSGSGGLQQDFRRSARQNPGITKLVTIGQTVKGRDIVALKLSRGARYERDGSKPAVLYLGAQHRASGSPRR